MRRWLVTLACVPFVVTACGGGSNGGGPTPTSPTNCTFTVANQTINVSATAGSTSVQVTTGSGCAWTVTSSQPWLTITSGTSVTGASTLTFSVAENTGAARTATITAGGVPITVNQAAGLPPVVLVGDPPNPVVGVPYNFQFTATGATGSFSYSYETGVGFPPIGIQLNNSGSLTGTATTAVAGTFGVCVADSTGRQTCRRFTLTPQPPATTGSAANGTWSGTIVLQVGCTAPLPSNYPWTGTIRTSATGGTEIVVSVPRALVFNEVHPVTITGQRLTFTVEFDSNYTFVADFSADFRSLSGTFTGGNCNVPPTIVLPSGTWNGTKQ